MKAFVIWVRSEVGRVAGLTLIVAGAVAMLAGYAGLSQATRLSAQLSYLVSGGLMGLLLAGLGAALMISADIHDEWRKLDQLREAVLSTQDGLTSGHSRKLLIEDESHSLPSGRGAKLRAGDSGSTRIRVLLATTALFGVVLLGGAWHQTATTIDQGDGVGAAVRAALVVMVLLGIAAFAVSVQRSAVTSRTAAVTAPLWRLVDVHPSDHVRVEVPYGAQPDEFYVTASGFTHYHRPGCPVVRDVATTTLKPAAVPSSLPPCQLCTVS